MFAAKYVGERKFSLVEGEKTSPEQDEVTIQVGFVGICGTDMHIYHGVMDQRVGPPQIIGHEMSGTIVQVGESVKGFDVGDRVVVRPLDYCGSCPACEQGHSHICHNLKFMGIDSPGAFQNYWTVKARTLHKLPSAISLQEGALIEPLAVACHDVIRARLAAGEKAVVIGGGPIGQLVALMAKAIGAEVMLSEVNASRRRFAANHQILTVDPLASDLKNEVDVWSHGKGADVVFEVSGAQTAVDVMTEIAAVRGRICLVAIHPDKPKVDLFKFFWKELELVGARVYERSDFDTAIELVASGKIHLSSFITSISSLRNIEAAFASMDNNPESMKAIVRCAGEKA